MHSLFYLIHLHVLFYFLRTPPFMITPHARLVLLAGFCCIFTSSRTPTITNPAPLHTLCTPILDLFYTLLAAPPPLINTPHLLHIPPTNHSHTPIFCFPLSSFLIKLFLFIYFFFFYFVFFIIIICLFSFIYLFIFFIIIIYLFFLLIFYLFIFYLFFYFFYLFIYFLLFLGKQIYLKIIKNYKK